MKKLPSVLLVFALLLGGSTVASAAACPCHEPAAQHIRSEFDRLNVPNAAVAVIQGGETSYILHGDTQQDTLFQIGSIAKSMTGFGVLLLEDMGLLSVYDSVNEHLPWFTVNYNGQAVPHADIAIYNLLHHTSGITDVTLRIGVEEVTKAELIEQLDGIELAFYPSTEFTYGNVNYVLLGLIIEAASGQTYEDFMTQAVFHPLGMYDTFMNAQLAHATGRVAGGHRVGFLGASPHEVSLAAILAPAGGGGAYSSIADMARWAGIHFGTIAVSPQFARVVQRSHMHHHATDAPFEGHETPHGAMTYGAGWIMFDSGRLGHSGGTISYSADMMIFPDRDMAVVFLSNLRFVNPAPWTMMIADAMEGEFNQVPRDLYSAIDIGMMVVIAVVVVAVFGQLAFGLSRHFGGSEQSPSLVGPGISLALSGLGLLTFYAGLPALFGVPFGDLMLQAPASTTPALVSIWVMFAFSLSSLLARVFIF